MPPSVARPAGGKRRRAHHFAKGYTGHEQTDASGLIYMQARFYAPWMGRFLSPDPGKDQHFEQTQSWNIYSYVRNNPVMIVDRSGQDAYLFYYGTKNTHIAIGVDASPQDKQNSKNNSGKRSDDVLIAGKLPLKYTKRDAMAEMLNGGKVKGKIMGGKESLQTLMSKPVPEKTGEKDAPTAVIRIKTTAAEDAKLRDSISGAMGKDAQWSGTDNCANFVGSMLSNIGINTSTFDAVNVFGVETVTIKTPNSVIRDVEKEKGKDAEFIKGGKQDVKKPDVQ